MRKNTGQATSVALIKIITSGFIRKIFFNYFEKAIINERARVPHAQKPLIFR